jgi:hypothetical protein
MDNGNANYSGTVSLPNDGQVQIANPDSTSGSTPSLTAPAPQAPSQTPQAPQAGAMPQQASQQPGQQPTQPQAPQPSGKPADLSKSPAGQPTPNGQAPAAQQAPHIAAASKLYDVAQTLSGNAGQYQYQVQPDGTTVQIPVRPSAKMLGLSLALTALSGGLTGLAEGKGAGNAGKGGAAAFDQAAQRNQQAQAQAKQNAQQDFAQRAQTAEVAFRQYATARQLGKMDMEDNQNYVNSYKDIADEIQKTYPGYIEAIVPSSQLSQFDVTKHMAIPYAVVPRLESDGSQTIGPDGQKKWNLDYMIVSPEFKGTNLLTPEAQATLGRYGVSGMNNPALQDSPLAARMALGLQAKATGIETSERTFNGIWNDIDSANKSNGSQVTSDTDVSKPGTLTTPAIKDQTIAGLLATSAAKYAPQVKGITPDNFASLVNGVADYESGGNQSAVSPTGAQGVMQLTGKTANGLNVDRTQTASNIDGGVKLLSQLWNKYQNPQSVLAAYYSGPSAVDKNGNIVASGTPNTPGYHTAEQTKRYVDDISNKIGLQTTSTAGPTASQNPDPAEFAKTHPGFVDAMTRFSAAYSSLPPGSEDKIGAALNHMQQSGQGDAASLMNSFFQQKGDKAVQIHDQYITNNQEDQHEAQLTQASEDRADFKAKQQQQQLQQQQDSINTVLNAKLPDNVRFLPKQEMISQLTGPNGLGVTLSPTILSDAQDIANYSAPMSIATARPYTRDGSLNQQNMLSIVKAFNPDYKEGNYQNSLQYTAANGKAQQTILSASGTANHLALLNQAAQEIATNGGGAGQFPALNKLKLQYGYQTGGNDSTTLGLIVQAVNEEMGRTLMGGTAPQKTGLEELSKTINTSNSLSQVQAFTNGATHIIYGKVNPYAEQYANITQGGRLPIPQDLTNLFQKNGLDTSNWTSKPSNAQQSSQNQQQQQQQTKTPNPQPNEKVLYRQGQFVGYSSDGKTITRLP